MYTKEAISEQRPRERHIQKYIVLGLWILMGAFYTILAAQWITFKLDDQAFADYTSHVVNLAAAQHRPAQEIRTLLLVKAEDLSLPVRPESIRILGGGNTLAVSVNYESDIRLPLVDRPVYRMKFEHDVHPTNKVF